MTGIDFAQRVTRPQSGKVQRTIYPPTSLQTDRSHFVSWLDPFDSQFRSLAMDVATQFWTLVESANELDAHAGRILNDNKEHPVDSNRMAEPVYLAICRLVTEHPGERLVFVRCFEELVLWKRKSPWMLVPFCMRILRMPEIKDRLRREMDETRNTARYASLMDYCSSVMHAYHDEVWENAVAFNSFAHELNSEFNRQ